MTLAGQPTATLQAGDIPGYHRASSDRAPVADRNSRKNRHVPTNPAVVANGHRLRELDIVPPALDFRLVRRCEDRYIRSDNYPVSNRDEPAVQDRQVEVGVEALAQADVAAVVDVERRLGDGFVVVEAADDLVEHGQASLLQRFKVGVGFRWEVVVVAMGPGAGFEAGVFQVGNEGVVAVKFPVSYNKPDKGYLACQGDMCSGRGWLTAFPRSSVHTARTSAHFPASKPS